MKASRRPRDTATVATITERAAFAGLLRSQPRRLRDELLPAVDVVRRAGERRVGHDVQGERGDVGWFDHAADWQRRPQLLPALLQLVSEQRCRQRAVDKTGRDEVDPDRR